MITVEVDDGRIQGYLTLPEIAEIFDVTYMAVVNMLRKGRFGNGTIKLASKAWLNSTVQKSKNKMVTINGDRIQGYSTYAEVAQRIGKTRNFVSQMIHEDQFDGDHISLTSKIWVPESDIIEKCKLYEGAYRMYKVKQCVVCGKDYIPINGRQKTCGAEDCRREIGRWKHRERYRREKERNLAKKRLVKPNTLVEDAMKAKQSGMSYGQYMAEQTKERLYS